MFFKLSLVPNRENLTHLPPKRKLSESQKAPLQVKADRTDFGLPAAYQASFAWVLLLHALAGLQVTLIIHVAHIAFHFYTHGG